MVINQPGHTKKVVDFFGIFCEGRVIIMNTAYIAIGVVLVIILVGGAWWYLRAPIADGTIFVDDSTKTKWAYLAASNSLIADRTYGDISGVFSNDMKTIKFSPSNVVMQVLMDNGNLVLSNGDTMRRV